MLSLIGKLFSIYNIENVYNTRSLVTHKALTTHSQISADDHLKAIINPGFIKLSLYIQHIDDVLQILIRLIRLNNI
jgi:O-acetylhomoserine (thiol)-lyase